MPTYDYACAACGHRFEVVHGVHGHGPESCPSCGGGPVRKAFAPPTLVFKGSGWAKVDRRSSSGSTKRETGDEGAKAKPSGGDAAATASTGSEGGSSPTAKTTD
jgi:putative FmdB family regulatory protein